MQGRWFVAPERVDLDLTLDRGWLGEWTALLRGDAGDVHGTAGGRGCTWAAPSPISASPAG